MGCGLGSIRYAITARKQICNELKKLPIQDLVDTQEINHINHELQAGYYAYAILRMIIEWVNEDLQHTPRYMVEQLLEIMNILNAVYKINQNQWHYHHEEILPFWKQFCNLFNLI
ncbi:TetR-like C-terminal domain-containing protein [Paenibacillus sp. TY11]|uniref:TetR-like C-terminal domain-containing protein n=1 Tax=Paenibacillus sp. TY11 TaxID=3448633 RepID=UPI0040398CA8